MFNLRLLYFTICLLLSNLWYGQHSGFVYVKGQDLYLPSGEKFLIKGTNLGNWLNPEGYMFLFDEVSSYRLINGAFCEMVGPKFTADFWKKFRQNYIGKEDIAYLKSTGINTIRIPFHYKLFTNEDFMGDSGMANGFAELDRVVSWCKEAGLYVILDMHDAPGGQTGDNIDDGYGYPWLFTNVCYQDQMVEIWTKIAEHYSQETSIIGYDLLNEPIAHYFEKDLPTLNAQLEPLYKRVTKSIRSVDKNHIVILAGAQWDTNFSIFSDWTFDANMMYTCHLYWTAPYASSLKSYTDFRTKTNLPMYMGETGENTDEWIAAFTSTMNSNNIGWTYWPYKKMVPKRGMMTIPTPKNWNLIVDFTKKDRSSFAKIREARPDQQLVKEAMEELLENMKFKNCQKNLSYIQAMGMKP